jgi:hypothetical protein
MHAMDPNKLSPSARQVFKMIEFDDEEVLLFEIRKHWFGLFIIYFTGSFITAVLLVVAVAAAASRSQSFEGISTSALALPVILICFIFAILSVIGTAIGAYLYRSNVMLVTSEKLAQLLAINIFHRKISQLSIGDVQDVTVQQRGVLPHLFHYGTIVIETAGEQQNYNFTYTPDPYECAKAIVNAHEENLKKYGN